MRLTISVTNSKGYLLDGPSSFVFDNRGGSIGRTDTNDCTLPDPERFISSKHALITFYNDTFTLVDTSVNGVFLNDSNEPVGKDNAIELSNGDRLSIGSYELQVSIEQLDELVHGIPLDTSAELKGEREPLSPWGVSDKPKNNPGLLDGNKKPAKKHNFAAWDGGRNDGEKSASSSRRSATESDHSPFGQQHYSPPSMTTAGGSQNWDRTDFTMPPDSEKGGLELNASDDVDADSGPAIFDPEADNIAEAGDTDNIHSVLEGNGRSENSLIPEVPDLHGAEQGLPDPVIRDQNLVEPYSREEAPPFSVGAEAVAHSKIENSDGNKGLESGESDAVQIFLRAAGLEETYIQPEAVPELMSMMGGVFGEVVQGLMDVLRARAELKNEFRMRHTQISITENNPLKFSVSLDEALQHIVFHSSNGFLRPEVAFDEALNDIKDHQIAMVAGMQSAFDSLLQRFDPQLLESRVREGKKIGHRLPINRKASCWDQYEALYAEISAAAEDDFRGLFGDEFTRAYEEQVSRLSLLRRKPEGEL